MEDAGSASVFTHSGTEWEFDNRLTIETPQGTDRLGTSVAVFDNTILVGIPLTADPGENDATGAVAVSP